MRSALQAYPGSLDPPYVRRQFRGPVAAAVAIAPFAAALLTAADVGVLKLGAVLRQLMRELRIAAGAYPQSLDVRSRVKAKRSKSNRIHGSLVVCGMLLLVMGLSVCLVRS